MKQIKAILIGVLVWILGVSIYSASFFIPILEDLELQANLFLAIAVIPISWLGAAIYFKIEQETPRFRIGIIMVLTAVTLDALLTVPFLIIPYGGSYQSFFTAPAFWLIATEILSVVIVYSKLKERRLSF